MWTRIKDLLAIVFARISNRDSKEAFHELEAKKSMNLDNLEYLRSLRIKKLLSFA